ncbi:DUF6056 family protein [Wenyingzhuangia sp. chi5]|uniref:DUF6056 family protein n=1 Tax=Wenyingzhuangia gilva TaxID=3057677 RepID=A0ABT8VP78_9FLAO|nr:DUF6056 family protein [Wenyingzhuangia sp. chi5]MDO3693775.1 DUF6056 family protein [Wenyingzhuangia sp. chi5]
MIKSCLSFIEKYIVVMAGVFFVFPFIIISFFNNPSSDDYCFASQVKELGFWAAQKATYNGWSGRYISTAILSLNIVNENNLIWYKLFPILLLMFLLIGIYFLVKNFFKIRSFVVNVEISILIFLLYLTQMPIISEGLYWWSGAITYQVANILTLFLLRSLVVLIRNKSVCNVFLGSLVGFIVAACNETSMILLNVLFVSVLIVRTYLNKKIDYQILVVFLAILISSAIVFVAPGNSVRGSFFPNQHRFLFSSVLASLDGFRYVLRWSGLTFLISIILYLKISKSVGLEFLREKLSFSSSISLMIVVAVLFSGFFIGFWTMGKPIPARSVNSVYLFYMVGFIYIVFKYLVDIKFNLIFSLKHTSLLLMMIVFSIMFDKKNMINVIDDLGRGTAYNYNIEVKERVLKTKHSEKNETLILRPITRRPITLLENDMKSDSDYFGNKCYANYWGLNEVIVKYE